MFEQYNEVFTIYRKTEASDWSDSAWETIGTFSGLWMPVSSGEEFVNDQNTEKFTDVITTPTDNYGLVKAKDGIVNADGRKMVVVSDPELWPHMIPHVVINLKSAQFDIG